MILRPLVLILGAGASMPYQFPSGSGLKKRILQQLRSSTSDLYREIISFFDSKEIIEDFVNNLAMSGQLSVDAFLEHRHEFLKIGKLAIAFDLIKLEREGIIFKIDREELSWYEYLFNKLNAHFEDFGNNKLSIITFNYDRSLEYFLFTALKNTSGKSDEKCAEVLNKIPIVHVHGKLGFLPWQGEPSKPYRPKCTHEQLEMASEQIIVIPEDIKTHENFTRAFDLMSKAHRICFLGFGYHDANLERLSQLKKDVFDRLPKSGTVYGLGSAEINYIYSKWKIVPCNASFKIMDFLKNDIPWIEFL